MDGIRKLPGLILALTALLWFLVACANPEPASDATSTATAPALMPAPTKAAVLPPTVADAAPATTATPDIVRPPTGTPTPLPAAPNEPTGAGLVQPALPTPLIASGSTPPAATSLPPAAPSLAETVDCESEIEAHQELLAAEQDLPAYEAPLLAACYLETGDRPAAILVYQTALQAESDRYLQVAFRQSLGDLLFEEGDYPAALAQYDAIYALAQTELSRGRALYQVAQAELLIGYPVAGYSRLLTLINDYPEAAQSYQAMNDLLAARYSIDDYQQGIIAFNAQVYDDAAAAFTRHIEAGDGSQADAYLYLAKSLEKLGDLESALDQIDALIAAQEIPAAETVGDPAQAAHARIERAKLLNRAGRSQAALDDYQAYLALYPQGEDAPLAAWSAATLTELLGNRSLATDRYLAFAQAYPEHRDAAQAWFRAGYLSWGLDEAEDAARMWQRALDTYPEQDYGAASLLWLLNTLPSGARAPYVEAALNGNGFGYYAQRARQLASGVEPFVTAGSPNLNTGDSGREFTDSWLREWLGLSPGAPVAQISGQLAADPRLQYAEMLWATGLSAEATRQFEVVRADYANDALASYQLALYFRDLGLYKPSILAALSVMQQAGVGATGAPRFLARLAYPAYHADLISAEAQRYGTDPLLQLALIHQESYFDSLATSPLGAQGLSQILPDTGTHIAGQLGWPGYDSGALYRPDVAVAFGAYFLDQQLDRYDGNVAGALAAYNAGPGFADGWVELEPDDYDRLLEAIDFPETQRYIKQIYTVHSIYRFLYS